eukprot:6460006-Amphidinium_carterae.1
MVVSSSVLQRDRDHERPPSRSNALPMCEEELGFQWYRLFALVRCCGGGASSTPCTSRCGDSQATLGGPPTHRFHVAHGVIIPRFGILSQLVRGLSNSARTAKVGEESRAHHLVASYLLVCCWGLDIRGTQQQSDETHMVKRE